MTTQRRTKNRSAPLTDDELREFARRYEAGEYIKALAAEAGYSWAGLHKALKRQGVQFRGRKGPSPKKVTADDPRVIEALRLRDTGMGYVQAAQKAGIGAITLRRFLVESGRDPQAHWRGEGAPNWNGGRQRTAEGYIRVEAAEFTDSMGGSRGQVLEHRLVVARQLGRPLTSTESVHHKNGKRDDNRPENLELWTGKHGKGVRSDEPHCPTCSCFE